MFLIFFAEKVNKVLMTKYISRVVEKMGVFFDVPFTSVFFLKSPLSASPLGDFSRKFCMYNGKTCQNLCSSNF